MPPIRSQSQRGSSQARGTDVRSQRGQQSRVRNTLKHDRDANMPANPAAQRDNFGSRHNADNVKSSQRARGRKKGPNLAQRESAQDTQPNRGAKNKQPGRRTRKSGSAKD